MTPSLLLGGVLAVVFSFWTATNGWAFVLFLVAVFVLAYLPGRLLVGLACPRVEAYERLILAVSLGLASTVAWFWLWARLGQRGLLWVWVLVAAVAALRRLRPADLLADLRGPGAAEVALTALALAPFTWVPIYFRNLVRLPDGGWSYYPLADVTHHLAFANELGHSLPPQVPFLPGQPLNYHFGQDMLVALFAEVPGLGVPDVALRFVPTLTMALVVGAVVCLGRLWLGSRRGAWLLAALVILGEDWSFFSGLATGVDAPWSIHFFGVPTIVSIYLLNPMLPGVGLLCLTLLCLCRYCRGEGRAWGAGASVFLLALASVKVFAFAHALTALAAAALVQLVRWRRGELLHVLLGAAVPFAPVAIMDAASTGGRFWIRLEAWPYVPAAFMRSGLGDTLLGESAKASFDGSATLTQAALFAVVVLPLFLLFSFGSRSLGVGRLLRGGFGDLAAVRWFLAIFVLLGPLISLTWAVTPRGFPGLAASYNNAVWFMVQSKFLAWVFAVEVMRNLWRSGRPVRRALALVAVLLSLPSSFQYLHYQYRYGRLDRLPPEFAQIVAVLEREASPGDVVYARPPFSSALVSLTRLRSPVFDVFPWSRLSREDLERRVAASGAFWGEWDQGRCRLDILAARSVRYVLADRGDGETSPIRAHPGLELLAANDRFALYARASPP